MRCAAVVVSEQDGEAGLALDERSDVPLTLSTLENHQIALPFAESLTRINVVGSFMDGPIWRENKVTGPARMVRSPFLAPVWEVSGQLFGLAVWTVDISINCLVAHTNSPAFKEQSTRDLFGRPTFFELFDHSLLQADKAHQFSTARTPLNRSALSNETIVPVQFRQVVVGIAVALDVTINRRNMPADLCCYLSYRYLSIQHIFDHAPFTQVKLFMRHLPFSLLSSKIGEISQPSLECAPATIRDLIIRIMIN